MARRKKIGGAPSQAEEKKRRKVLLDIQRRADAMTRQDISDWRNAWRCALNIQEPRRDRLYDIYRDVSVDLHLSGCVEQRTDFALARSFKLVNIEDGMEVPEATELLEGEWFKELMRLSLESIYWGHSLIELGTPFTDGAGHCAYSEVHLVPRKHVVPEYGVVVRSVGDPWRTGIKYREEPYAEWLIEVGSPSDLGLYLKAATQTIPKKNMMGYWDTFGEVFGMPMRIAKTTSLDDAEHQRLGRALAEMGSKAWAVMGEDTEIQIVENARTDAYNVYDRRIERCDKELSKLVIGQTMTIEDGSSLSQSQTHLTVFQNLVEKDCDMLRDMVNHQLLPRMVRHGFPVEGLRFEWDYAVDYTPEQQVAYEQMIADRYDVDPQYFADKYNMPVGERRTNEMPTAMAHDGDGVSFF